MQMYRKIPATVNPDLTDSGILEAALTYFDTWLTALDIKIEEAALYFCIDYASARCRYIDFVIPTIAKKTAATNAKKYDKLISIYLAEYDPLENYDRTETATHTRTPNLTHATSSSTSASGTTSNSTTTQNKQTHTQTITPTNYATTTETKTAPFDTANYQNREQVTATQSGINTISDSYTGNPDETTSSGTQSTSATGTESKTETGTETTVTESNIHGNIGIMSTQNMAEQELALAEKMAIWNVIKRDLAAALLIQVW